MSDNIQHLLEAWPVSYGQEYFDGPNIGVIQASNYYAPQSLFEGPLGRVQTNRYQTVAATPVEEMKKWIMLMESGMKKKSSLTMLTERDPLASQTPVEQPLPLPKSSLQLLERDPLADQTPVDMPRSVPISSVEAVVERTQQTYNTMNTVPQWKEIDPTTGKSVEEKKGNLTEEDSLVGWKML